MLGLHFVKTKILDNEYARFYAQMFNNRISGDYDDFITFDLDMLEELIPQAEKFIEVIETIINETWKDKNAQIVCLISKKNGIQLNAYRFFYVYFRYLLFIIIWFWDLIVVSISKFFCQNNRETPSFLAGS